jgi:hypothetical protein
MRVLFKTLAITALLAVVSIIIAKTGFLSPKDDFLLIGLDNSWENGGPVSVLNLTTEASTTIAFMAAGCDGFAYDKKTEQALTNCRFGTEQNIHYSLTEETYTRDPILPEIPSLHSPMVCDAHHTCYFGKGNFEEDGSAEARILVTRKGILQADVTVSDEFGEVIPTRFKKDGEELWVLGVTAFGLSSRILVLDTKNDNTLRTFATIDSDAWDFEVSEKFVVVSVNRRTVGVDVYIYEKESGKLLQSLIVPGNEHTFNALGVEIVHGSLFVAGGQGVYRYSLSDFTEAASFKTSAFTAELAYGNKHLYATVPAESKIYELEPETLTKVREFKKNLGFGRIYVID